MKYQRLKIGVLVQEHNRHRPSLYNYLLDEVIEEVNEEILLERAKAVAQENQRTVTLQIHEWANEKDYENSRNHGHCVLRRKIVYEKEK